jgi:hypothetical protein
VNISVHAVFLIRLKGALFFFKTNSSTSLAAYKRMLKNIRSSGILNYREAMEIISFLPSQQKKNNIFPLRSLRLERSGR